MNKNKVLLYSITVLIFGLCLLVFRGRNNKEFIVNSSENNKLLNEYENILNDIYDNMNYVSGSNDDVNKDISWTSYKLEMPEENKNVYDSLVRDIRYCYVYFTDDGITYTNSNYLSKFKNMNKVSKKEFEEKTKLYSKYNASCLDNFDKYEDLLLNKELKDLEVVIRPILIYKNIYNMEVNSYEELLKNEYYKASLIKNVSDFLKLKYDEEK